MPIEAVDVRVRTNIEIQGSQVRQDADVYGCGCQYLPRERAYRLCRYHDGLNDGIAMMSSPSS